MRNYRQKGETVTLIAPADVLSGEVVIVGSFFGVAEYSALAGEEVETNLVGVFTLPKLTTDAISQGNPLYWDIPNKRLTKTAGTGSKPLAGVATIAAANGVNEVDVRLTGTGTFGPA